MINLKLEDYIGVCVKNSEGYILERNALAAETCGQFCSQFCINKLKSMDELADDNRHHGFVFFPRVRTAENKVTDVVISRIDDKITTLLYPLNQEIEASLKKYQGYNLTPSELNVVALLLEGHSNQAIADQLFISVLTLKKHLNHIYKKIPPNAHPRPSQGRS